jgi:microcystin-dependent protein
MDQPFIGSIVLFAGNFAPRGWAFCQGQILSIAQNTALFSILGTTYGGNGQTTFALPDLRGRAPVSAGQGPGLSDYGLGQTGGFENTTLLSTQMPAHNHSVQITAQVQVSTQSANSDEPNGAFLTTTGNNFYAAAGTAGNNLGGVSASGTTGISGANQPISIMQPYLALNYIIALQGIFPSRN